MNEIEGFDLGPDVEVLADEWADEQEALAELYRELNDEMHPLDGIFLDGKQVYERKDGELITSDGKVVNSCDALRIIDGDVEELDTLICLFCRKVRIVL